MNKQELINELKKLLAKPSETQGTELDFVHEYGIRRAITLVKQLDEQQAPINEPEKPVVPQFVADWYEEHKDNFEMNLYNLCVDFHKRKLPDDLYEWFNKLSDKPIETLVMIHKFGYEAEKEQLYEVFLKRNGAQLGVCVPHGEDKTQFTKVELQEYDFDNLDAFEIKEVDE